MIRNTHPLSTAAWRGARKLATAIAVTATLAASAQAANIGFEGYLGPVGGTEVWQEGNYNVGFYANQADGGEGYLVGQFIDGIESSCDSSSMACPVGHAGTYYGALNDSYIDIWTQDDTAFRVAAFDAAFIGSSPSLGSYPAIPALVRLQGFLADGSYLLQDFQLTGATPAGFQFGRFETTGAFAQTAFVELLAFGLVCNATGSSCTAFNTNRAQFGIDNIELNAVPEPGTVAMLGLGLAGLVGARRRKLQQA